MSFTDIIICGNCDGPDIADRWRKHVEEFEALKKKFWWALEDYCETK
jgi:hypothetical protein